MIHNNQPVSKVAKKGRGQDAMPREPQQPNPSRIAETRAQDMYEKVYMVDCCVFPSCPPPIRPLLRANFRALSSFFCVIFPPPQRKHAKEFRDRTFGCTFLMLCKMCTFMKKPELSFGGFVNQGEKSCEVGRPAIFAFSHASPRWKTDGGKTACYFSPVEWLT